MQADFLHQQFADFAIRDEQPGTPVRRGEHPTDGVARSRKIELAIHLADARLAQVDGRKQLGQLELARGYLCAGLDRVLAAIKRYEAPEVPTGEAEVERI